MNTKNKTFYTLNSTLSTIKQCTYPLIFSNISVLSFGVFIAIDSTAPYIKISISKMIQKVKYSCKWYKTIWHFFSFLKMTLSYYLTNSNNMLLGWIWLLQINSLFSLICTNSPLMTNIDYTFDTSAHTEKKYFHCKLWQTNKVEIYTLYYKDN